MKVYTVQDLNLHGIDYQAFKEHLKLTFFDKIFVRNGDFPKRFREEAIRACQVCQQASLNSFLVETPFLITLWTEEKRQNSSEPQKNKKASDTPTGKVYRGIAYDTSPETAESQKSIKSEKEVVNAPSGKVYRGIAYASNSESLEVTPSALPQRKKPRTYRGQEY